MESKNKKRQINTASFFDSSNVKPILLTENEVDKLNKFLTRLYSELGSVTWIKLAFTKALDVYWKMRNATREDAMELEGTIDSQIKQVVMTRQFSRLPDDAVKNFVTENTVDIVDYWNSHSDPYPPSNIENMDEPFRAFFLLLRDLAQEMNNKDDPAQAINFIAALMSAFALTYPISYLASDLYFQRYVQNELGYAPLDDDCTFYLCRDIHYMLFDRF